MKIVSKTNTESSNHEHNGFACRRWKLSAASGGRELGASLYEIEPGRAAWPFHAHMGNEEAIYVVSGAGALRTPQGRQRVEAGDFVSFPPGLDNAHQLINDGDAPLTYLCVSTMRQPDVTCYPDSDKIGVFTGTAPGGQGERPIHGYFEAGSDVDYWEAERWGPDEDDEGAREGR